MTYFSKAITQRALQFSDDMFEERIIIAFKKLNPNPNTNLIPNPNLTPNLTLTYLKN